MLQNISNILPAAILFFVYAFYLVARSVYFLFKRDLYLSGYQDGTYSKIDQHVKMKYHPDTNTCACVVSDTEFNEDMDAAYKRYCAQ